MAAVEIYPMKKTTLLGLLLALSLSGNLAYYFNRNSSRAAGGDISGPVPPRTVQTSAVPARPEREDPVAVNAAETAAVARTRKLLESDDLETLVGKLRAAGFSPAMIRTIIYARVQEQFSARRKALLAGQEEQPYWKTGRSFTLDAKTMSSLRDLGREQSALLKSLLGAENVPQGEEQLMYQRRQFGDLSRDKVEQVQSILSDYGDLQSQVYAEAKGVILPEDREKLALLEKERRADLEAVLTPEELENYELRSSSTASALRSQLALFNPTEEEFRAIFKLQQAFDDKFGSRDLVTNAVQYRERQEQQKALLAQVEAVLSPDRVEAYRQAIDPAYQMANRLVARLELPPAAATQIVAIQQDIQKRAAQVRADRSLATEVRNMQLTALAREAGSKLTDALGSHGLEAYKSYGGQWVDNLVPKTRVVSPPR